MIPLSTSPIDRVRRRRPRLARVTCLTLGALSGGMLVHTASAVRAAAVDMSCAGYQSTSYTPGLTLTPRKVSFTRQGLLSPCTSSDPSLLWGTYTLSGVGTFSCVGVSTASGTGLFHWSNGQTSRVDFVTTANLKPGGQQVIVTRGPVTSGEFAGDSMTRTVNLVAAHPEGCLTDRGVLNVGGPVTVTFTPS